MNGLVEAREIEPGVFLTPPQYRDVYVENRFNREMGATASDIAERVRGRDATWSVSYVRGLLAIAAGARRALGGKAGISYGQPVPENLDEVAAAHERDLAHIPIAKHHDWTRNVFQLWGVLRDFLAGKSQIDPAKVSGTDHRALITLDEPSGSWCHIDIDGQRLGLSVLVKERGEFVLSHPSYERMVRIRNVAYELLVRSLDRDPYDLDGLARAYQLFIHATPWFNGTASILETFYDALFRARGMAFPRKTSEPYFDAVFHVGVYAWSDLIQCFDGTAKPVIFQVL